MNISTTSFSIFSQCFGRNREIVEVKRLIQMHSNGFKVHSRSQQQNVSNFVKHTPTNISFTSAVQYVQTLHFFTTELKTLARCHALSFPSMFTGRATINNEANDYNAGMVWEVSIDLLNFCALFSFSCCDSAETFESTASQWFLSMKNLLPFVQFEHWARICTWY